MQAISRQSHFKFLSLIFLALIIGVSGCKKSPSLNLENQGRLDQLEERPELNAEGLIRMAQRMETAGDYANAMTFYADALNRDSSQLEAYLGLARILSAVDQGAQATLYYGRAHSLAPDDASILTAYTLGLIEGDRPEMASQAIAGYLAGHETTANLQNLLGVAYDLQANHTMAQDAYNAGIDLLGPSDDLFVRLTNNLALSLAISDKYSEAVLLLNSHVGDMRLGLDTMTRHQSLYRQNLAIVYAISGQTEAAVDVAKSALNEQEAEFNRNFYETIPTLSGYDRTRAVFLRKLPDPGT